MVHQIGVKWQLVDIIWVCYLSVLFEVLARFLVSKNLLVLGFILTRRVLWQEF